MSTLQRALLVLSLIAVSAVAFRPVLVQEPSEDRMLASTSTVLLLETNGPRSFSIGANTLAMHYWDVPTVPVPMKIEVTPTTNTDDAYEICYYPEAGDYDQDVLGTCTIFENGGFGVVKLTASYLRKYHGKNLRVYVQKPATKRTISVMSGSVVIKRDNQKAVAIGVAVGVGGAALLGVITCSVMKFRKGKQSNDKNKDEKKEKKKNDKDDKEKEKKKEKKEKNDKKRKNSEDSDKEQETSTPHKCGKCNCHKGVSDEHLNATELDFYFPSNRYDAFQTAILQNSCTVCSVEFRPEDSCRQIYCGHIFHTGCVDNQVYQHDKCPTCESSMTRDAIQSLLMLRFYEHERVAKNNEAYRPEQVLVALKKQH